MHKKAALLRENFRADFVAWLDRQETLEQIAQIADDRGQVAAQHRHLQIEFKRQMYLLNVRVSNVSFGLSPAARATLNSVMLYHADKAGLDMAIVNPAQVTPYAEIPPEERSLAEDLILNRRPDALQRMIEHFEQSSNHSKGKTSGTQAALSEMSAEQRLHYRILHRLKEGVEQDIDEIISRHPDHSRHQTAVTLLNTVLLPAMKEVGDKFGSGEFILPFVLQSAEVMKKSVSHLETYLEKKDGVSKGTIVLATVYGDVHDIGKNLVKGRAVPRIRICTTVGPRRRAYARASGQIPDRENVVQLVVVAVQRLALRGLRRSQRNLILIADELLGLLPGQQRLPGRRIV